MVQSAIRPQLVSPRTAQTLEAVRSVTGGFDVDAWHVMNERDNALIEDEILHGAGSSTFVYQFEIQGKAIAGISVIGARHLAAHYKGLQHRIVASMEKIGALFTFVAYPGEHPMSVSASVVAELADEPDFYAAVVEMTDLKTGNRIQSERREARVEYRRDGSSYERPNYATIAQSKAYRNAVLALIPQDVVITWREAMLRLKKTETITASVLDEKRASVVRFAAQRALALDRQAVEALTLDQISGLGDAAREGRLPAFVEAARALGLEVAQGETGEPPAEPVGTREGVAGNQPTQTQTPQSEASGAASEPRQQEGSSPSPADRSQEGESSTPRTPPGGRRPRVRFNE
jgi:hypothetical protein